MQVQVKGQAKPPVATAEVLLEGEGATIVLTLEADEELVDAQLKLTASTGPAPTFTAATIATDKGTTQGGAPILASITWVSADWGTTRTLERIAIDKLQNASDTRVRLQVARGSSQWYSPPGPNTFSLTSAPAGQVFTAVLPDTVADRVMLEFFVANPVQPVLPVTLTAAPTLTFGSRARDITLKVQGKRQLFDVAGVVGDPVVVPELIAGLREQKQSLVGPGTITLELVAGAAGLVGLDWRFVTDAVRTTFVANGSASTSLSLPWNGRAEVPLFRRASKQAARARIEGLALALQHEPLRERLVLVPSDALLNEAVGELVRPAIESAQRFELAAPQQLIGASIWARPLTQRLVITASLYADASGAPAAQPLATTQVVLDEPEVARAEPRWIELEFPTVVETSAGSLWLVVGCDEGELAWLVAHTPLAAVGELRQRRHGGAWLTRATLDPQGWALLRVRALEQGQLAAPSVELVLRDRQAGPQTVPLALDAAGRIAWTPSAPSNADAAGDIVLVVHSTVPTNVTLSDLRLRHRLVSPPPDIQIGNPLTP